MWTYRVGGLRHGLAGAAGVLALAACSPPGPPDALLQDELDARYSWAEVTRLKSTDRLEQQGMMGTVVDGRFAARARTTEPLYREVATYREGTVVAEATRKGTAFEIVGGFVTGRDAGTWGVEFRDTDIIGTVPGNTIDSYTFRRPVAVQGTEAADEIASAAEARERAVRERAEREQRERREAEARRQAEARAQAEAKAAAEAAYAARRTRLPGTWVAHTPMTRDDGTLAEGGREDCKGPINVRLVIEPGESYPLDGVATLTWTPEEPGRDYKADLMSVDVKFKIREDRDGFTLEPGKGRPICLWSGSKRGTPGLQPGFAYNKFRRGRLEGDRLVFPHGVGSRYSSTEARGFAVRRSP